LVLQTLSSMNLKERNSGTQTNISSSLGSTQEKNFILLRL